MQEGRELALLQDRRGEPLVDGADVIRNGWFSQDLRPPATDIACRPSLRRVSQDIFHSSARCVLAQGPGTFTLLIYRRQSLMLHCVLLRRSREHLSSESFKLCTTAIFPLVTTGPRNATSSWHIALALRYQSL